MVVRDSLLLGKYSFFYKNYQGFKELKFLFSKKTDKIEEYFFRI